MMEKPRYVRRRPPRGNRIWAHCSATVVCFSWNSANRLKSVSTRWTEPNTEAPLYLRQSTCRGRMVDNSGTARAYGCLRASFRRLEREIRPRGAVLPPRGNSNAVTLHLPSEKLDKTDGTGLCLICIQYTVHRYQSRDGRLPLNGNPVSIT